MEKLEMFYEGFKYIKENFNSEQIIQIFTAIGTNDMPYELLSVYLNPEFSSGDMMKITEMAMSNKYDYEFLKEVAKPDLDCDYVEELYDVVKHNDISMDIIRIITNSESNLLALHDSDLIREDFLYTLKHSPSSPLWPEIAKMNIPENRLTHVFEAVDLNLTLEDINLIIDPNTSLETIWKLLSWTELLDDDE